MKLIFATGNKGKLREARDILGPGYEIVTPRDLDPEFEDPEETGTSFRENSIIKAKAVWDRFHLPCFADDSGLEIAALGGEPGVYSARYAGENKDFECNIDKVLDKLSQASLAGNQDRSACFHCTVTLITGASCGNDALSDCDIHCFDGILEGSIAARRRGTLGFGYDPVFIPAAIPDHTFGELGEDVKNQFSHRQQALKAMVEYLNHTI